jgi:hypothetical protein
MTRNSTKTTCRVNLEMSRLEPIPVLKDLLIQCSPRSEFQDNTSGIGHPTTTRHASLPHPPSERPLQFGSVQSVRTRNSMCPIKFSAQHTPRFRPFVRDKFGTERSSGGTPEKRLVFFGFLARVRWDTVTHNPLVPGSSPGGPTISLGIHRLMTPRARDSSPLV